MYIMKFMMKYYVRERVIKFERLIDNHYNTMIGLANRSIIIS